MPNNIFTKIRIISKTENVLLTFTETDIFHEFVITDANDEETNIIKKGHLLKRDGQTYKVIEIKTTLHNSLISITKGIGVYSEGQSLPYNLEVSYIIE